MNSSSKVAWIRAALLVALVAGANTGCYLLQSAAGQWSLMSKRQPLAEVIAKPSTPAALREELREAAEIRDYATRVLGLPDNGSYRSYVDLGRPYVVWNVVAAPEFSVLPKQWCYPVAGCVAYRGYFAESRARAYAAQLRSEGFDVSVDGVAAYSTLGHFDDPILSTMVGWSDAELAAIIFHELSHQLIYVPGDSSFNEALATTIEEEGVRRWLRDRGRESELESRAQRRQRFLAVVELLNGARSRLQTLYSTSAPPAELRAAKRAVFASLRADYARLGVGWGDRQPFADWFARGLNNADLASLATYYACVPGFERELAAAGGDLRLFYERMRALAKLDQARRDRRVCGEAAPTAGSR